MEILEELDEGNEGPCYKWACSGKVSDSSKTIELMGRTEINTHFSCQIQHIIKTLLSK